MFNQRVLKLFSEALAALQTSKKKDLELIQKYKYYE